MDIEIVWGYPNIYQFLNTMKRRLLIQSNRQEMRLTPESDLRRMANALLEAAGVPKKSCDIVSDHLVEASLQGVDSHGIAMLPRYMRRIENGIVKPHSQTRIRKTGTCTARVYGDFNFGQVVMMRATNLAIDIARTNGMSAVSVSEIDHIGVLRYYVSAAARRGMIAIAMTNGGPAMAPAGGIEPVVGPNPIAFAIPTGGEPMFLDMATSVSARSRIYRAKLLNEPIPDNWALGPDGKQTTDPSRALAGSLQPMGGYKGFGLAMMIDIMCGGLANSAMGKNVVSLGSDESKRPNVAAFLLCIKVSEFLPLKGFKRGVDSLITGIKTSRRKEGTDTIFVPGEPDMLTREKRTKEGIPIDDITWASLRECALKWKVDSQFNWS